MNTCTQLRPRLSDYLDRHLDEAGTRETRAHLAACADCRHLADALVRVRGAAQSLGPITPPAHLWLEIAGRVRQDGGTPSATAVTPAPPVVARRADTWRGLALGASVWLPAPAV